MDAGAVLLTSLDQTVEQVSQRLVAKQNAALVAAPGCGSTTLLVRIRASLTQQSADIIDFDLTAEQFISNSIARLSQLAAVTNNQARVLVIDHAARLAREDLTRWFEAVRDNSPRLGTTCLWVGQLDSRLVEHDFGFQLHSSPRSHVSFPLLPRHDALAAYRCIAESHGCKWGEAILFLLLDFCGNDLALVESATEYLYGDWSSKLYDTTVWDRVARWLAHSARVQEYRALIRNLSDECKRYLTLVRLGGKPLCRRRHAAQPTPLAAQRPRWEPLAA